MKPFTIREIKKPLDLPTIATGLVELNNSSTKADRDAIGRIERHLDADIMEIVIELDNASLTQIPTSEPQQSKKMNQIQIAKGVVVGYSAAAVLMISGSVDRGNALVGAVLGSVAGGTIVSMQKEDK